MLLKLLRTALVAGAVLCVPFAASAQDLTVGLSANVTSIDPHFHALSPNNNIAGHIFDRLVHQDERQKLTPGLATEWKVLDDTTWEFKLRQGVKFHDGSDFTADDVIASLKRVPWVPNSPSSFALYMRAIKESQIVDPYTIRFTTARPYPLLPVDLANIFIVSRKAEQAPTGDFNSGRATIGTGPYRFVEYLPGDRIVLQRNDNYWGPKPPWPRVTMKLITNDPARVAALLAGDVQIIEAVPTQDISKLKNNANVQLWRIISNRLIYLHVDSFRDQTPLVTDKAGAVLPNNPLKDARVRRALSKAINRPAIVERLMEGEAIPAGDLLPDGFFGASPKLKPEAFDPEGARRLLTEAGYPNGFGLTINGPNDRYVNDEKIVQAIGPMLTRIGIATKVVTEPWATFASKGSAPNYAYSLMLVGWGSGTGETSSPLRSLLSTVRPGFGGSNRGRYSNPKLDAVLDEALATVDDEKREKLLQDAGEIAMNDVAIIPLHYQVNVWATRKGYAYTPRTDENTYAFEVRPAK
ncbi:MAG: ABC transporter substrate-binding protein [Proteobacteria bacterium]|nr:ABC transporter substrate-binding protein [Pseudomonadota bacterium]